MDISWRAAEYTYNEKSVDWFWGLALGTLVIAITAIVFDNILLAILILIAGFSVALLAVRRPRTIEFVIGKRGIKVDTKLHRWNNLESFWLEEESNPPKIILMSQHWLHPHITVPLGNVSPTQVNNALLEYLPQIEQHESMIDLISERLGF